MPIQLSSHHPHHPHHPPSYFNGAEIHMQAQAYSCLWLHFSNFRHSSAPSRCPPQPQTPYTIHQTRQHHLVCITFMSHSTTLTEPYHHVNNSLPSTTQHPSSYLQKCLQPPDIVHLPRYLPVPTHRADATLNSRKGCCPFSMLDPDRTLSSLHHPYLAQPNNREESCLD